MESTTERSVGHYEVQEVEFGQVYRWRPERVVECDCGERLSLAGSVTVCSCGVKHAAEVNEKPAAGRSGDELLHPWRYAGGREEAGIPF